MFVATHNKLFANINSSFLAIINFSSCKYLKKLIINSEKESFRWLSIVILLNSAAVCYQKEKKKSELIPSGGKRKGDTANSCTGGS